MLAAFPTAGAGTSPSQSTPAQSVLAQSTWIDLIDPNEAERSAFETAFGLRVPTKDELGEIEATSRLQTRNGALYMTAPLIFVSGDEPWIPTPAGFVLTNASFADGAVRAIGLVRCGGQRNCPKARNPAPPWCFARILEELVDHMADLLEASGRDLDDASHVIFRQDGRKRSKLSHETAMLRQLMIRTGRTSERMARIHYLLVCLDRMAKFTSDRCRDWVSPDIASRLQSVSSDIASLVQFAEGLVSRVQLLQDAATGIINIDQNDVIKVLTVASVAGIPPVLVVRNLRHELQEHAGIGYGAGVIPTLWL